MITGRRGQTLYFDSTFAPLNLSSHPSHTPLTVSFIACEHRTGSKGFVSSSLRDTRSILAPPGEIE